MLVAPLSTSVLYLVTHSTLDYTRFISSRGRNLSYIGPIKLEVFLSIWGTSVSLKKYREGGFFAG